MEMKILKTNAALGNNQFAFLLFTGEFEGSKRYLVVDTASVFNSDFYKIGNLVELEDCEVENAIGYDVKKSPIFNTFLFQYFIKSMKFSVNNNK